MKRKVLVAIAIVLAALLLLEVFILLRKGNEGSSVPGETSATGSVLDPAQTEVGQNSEPAQTRDPNELPLIPAQPGKPAETESADKDDNQSAKDETSAQENSREQTETTEDPDGLDENELPPIPAI